jgi:hypothetical protein
MLTEIAAVRSKNEFLEVPINKTTGNLTTPSSLAGFEHAH